MIRVIAQVRNLPTALIVCGYAAAVLTLTWLTQDGHLGDAGYGAMSMLLMAFPLSLVGTSLHGPLQNAIVGQNETLPYGWDFVLMAWPGILTAVALAVLLMWTRTRPAATVIGWALSAFVVLVGVVTTFDGWAPRRPYGWPFIVYGLIMIIGLIAARRSAPKNAAASAA